MSINTFADENTLPLITMNQLTSGMTFMDQEHPEEEDEDDNDAFIGPDGNVIVPAEDDVDDLDDGFEDDDDDIEDDDDEEDDRADFDDEDAAFEEDEYDDGEEYL